MKTINSTFLIATLAFIGSTIPFIHSQPVDVSSSSTSSTSASAASSSSTASASSPLTNSTTTNSTVPSSGPFGLDNIRCSDVTLITPVNSSNVHFINVDDNYSNETYILQELLEFTTDQANWTANHIATDKQNFSSSFNISGHYCSPKSNAKQNSSLLVAVHGIGFDSSYWNFDYAQNYSFVRHAASYGYSSFIFDRLGTGNSTIPKEGAFSVVQAPTELAILTNILQQARNTTNLGNQTHDKITLIGHSYGSGLSNAISQTAPELIDNLILTGFSTNSSYQANFAQAGAFRPFKYVPGLENNTNFPAFYIGNNNISAVELFLDPPNYEQQAAQLAFNTSQPLTLGQLTSLGTIIGPSMNYTGPVFVVNGERDLPFCGRQCNAKSGNYSNMAEAVQQLYPVTKNFTSYLQPFCGHGISPSPYSGQVYEKVMQQIIGTGN